MEKSVAHTKKPESPRQMAEEGLKGLGEVGTQELINYMRLESPPAHRGPREGLENRSSTKAVGDAWQGDHIVQKPGGGCAV